MNNRYMYWIWNQIISFAKLWFWVDIDVISIKTITVKTICNFVLKNFVINYIFFKYLLKSQVIEALFESINGGTQSDPANFFQLPHT